MRNGPSTAVPFFALAMSPPVRRYSPLLQLSRAAAATADRNARSPESLWKWAQPPGVAQAASSDPRWAATSSSSPFLDRSSSRLSPCSFSMIFSWSCGPQPIACGESM